MDAGSEERRAPGRTTIFGLLATLWYGLSCLDFGLTNMREPSYVAKLPPAMIDFIDAMPAWAIGAWGISVVSGLIGGLLLIDRSRRAVIAFALSLFGLVASEAYRFASDGPTGMETGLPRAVVLLAWIAALAMVVYTLRLRRRRVLR